MTNPKIPLPAWLRALGLVFLLAGRPAFAASPAAPADADLIVAAVPMQFVAEGAGVHGQFVVAPEIISPDASGDLIYTITIDRS